MPHTPASACPLAISSPSYYTHPCDSSHTSDHPSSALQTHPNIQTTYPNSLSQSYLNQCRTFCLQWLNWRGWLFPTISSILIRGVGFWCFSWGRWGRRWSNRRWWTRWCCGWCRSRVCWRRRRGSGCPISRIARWSSSTSCTHYYPASTTSPKSPSPLHTPSSAPSPSSTPQSASTYTKSPPSSSPIVSSYQ